MHAASGDALGQTNRCPVFPLLPSPVSVFDDWVKEIEQRALLVAFLLAQIGVDLFEKLGFGVVREAGEFKRFCHRFRQ